MGLTSEPEWPTQNGTIGELEYEILELEKKNILRTIVGNDNIYEALVFSCPHFWCLKYGYSALQLPEAILIVLQLTRNPHDPSNTNHTTLLPFQQIPYDKTACPREFLLKNIASEQFQGFLCSDDGVTVVCLSLTHFNDAKWLPRLILSLVIF